MSANKARRLRTTRLETQFGLQRARERRAAGRTFSFSKLSRAEKRDAINSGRVRLINRTFAGNNFQRIKATGCSLRGNNNNFEGDENLIYGDGVRGKGDNNVFYGENNRCEGVNNLFFDAHGSALDESGNRPARAECDAPPQEQQEQQEQAVSEEPRSRPMPAADAPPSDSNWKRCVLDLPGDSQSTALGELQCIVCFDKKRDTIYEPCGHTSVCRECTRTLYNPDKSEPTPSCPQCRTKIEFSRIIF